MSDTHRTAPGTEVAVFEYSGRTLRTVMIDGQAWFVAADVAALLEYRMASDLTRSLAADLRGTHPMRTPSGMQDVAVISEPGLWKAIMQRQTGRMADHGLRSRIEKIQNWVTRDVMPTIRSTGRYDLPGASPLPAVPGVDLAAMEQMLADGPAVLMLLSKTSERLALTMAENHRLTVEVEVMKPKARLADRLLTAHGDMSVREAAQCLAADHGIDTGQNRLFDYLREIRWIDAKDTPYQRHIDAGRIRTRPTSYDHPKTGVRVLADPQVRITAKGLADLHRMLTGETEQLALMPAD